MGKINGESSSLKNWTVYVIQNSNNPELIRTAPCTHCLFYINNTRKNAAEGWGRNSKIGNLRSATIKSWLLNFPFSMGQVNYVKFRPNLCNNFINGQKLISFWWLACTDQMSSWFAQSWYHSSIGARWPVTSLKIPAFWNVAVVSSSSYNSIYLQYYWKFSFNINTIDYVSKINLYILWFRG